MKRGFIAALFLFACRCLTATDNSEITLFAGGRWLPHWDYGYPYGRYAPCRWPYAEVGLGVPLYSLADARRMPYGYYADPWWGFGYGVRYSLTEPRYADPLTGEIQWPLPGATPLKLRDQEQERVWSKEISAFIGDWDTEVWLHSETNTPVLRK